MLPTKQQWKLLSTKRPGSVDEVLEILLENRCMSPSVLNTQLKDLEPYLAIQGMDEAAQLTARHLSKGNKIVLVGDYDCDGVTSAAQFSLFLRDIGYTAYVVVIPNRSEGYGVPQRAILEHPDAGLLVAMDCGTHDVQAISLARSRGVDCIVIDHHEVSEGKAAPANILINPKQPGCGAPFKEFCASGLTLLFLTRLRKAIAGNFPPPRLGGKYLSLASLGTVADVVPLVEGNRIIAKTGLSHINQANYMPIKQIIDITGFGGKPLTSGHLSYYLAPRINVAGRISDPHLAYDLLVSEDEYEAGSLALKLNRLNSERQYQEDKILRAIREHLSDEDLNKRTLVLGDPLWPHGLVGIIASRIQQELHYGPTILFSVNEKEGTARGSARSVPGFDIYAALNQCNDLLQRWGGHQMAAGLTIAIDQIQPFWERLEEIAQQYEMEVFIPRGKIDLEIDLQLITTQLLDALKQFEPHGMGNPSPTFAVRSEKVCVQKVFGRDKNHVRLLLGDSVKGIYWKGMSCDKLRNWHDGDATDMVFHVEWDHYSKAPVANIKHFGRLSLG